MPNRAPHSPPMFRIYTVTQEDTETLARARETLRRSMQILRESRNTTSRRGYRKPSPPAFDGERESREPTAVLS